MIKPKQMLRIKSDGMQVLLIDPDCIISISISIDDEGLYFLLLCNEAQMYIVCSGTFDECHHKLNQLNKILNINIIDI